MFPGEVANWDSNKVWFCFWVSLYTNIYENPDKPPEYIIEDDKRFDEWIMNYSKKQRDSIKGLPSGKRKSAVDHKHVHHYDTDKKMNIIQE